MKPNELFIGAWVSSCYGDIGTVGMFNPNNYLVYTNPNGKQHYLTLYY